MQVYCTLNTVLSRVVCMSVPEHTGAGMVWSEWAGCLQWAGTRVLQAEPAVILAVRPAPVRLKIL